LTEGAVRAGEAALSISEDRDEATQEQATRTGIDADPDYDAKEAPSVAKWGMAGLLLVYAGLGTYCVASTLGGGAGSPLPKSAGPVQPEGVARSVAAALTQPAAKGGSLSSQSAAVPAAGSSRGAMSAGRASAGKSAVKAVVPTPAVEALTAVSAVAIGPDGTADGDHPELASYAIDPQSGMSWVTHWYATAHFGNLQQGTGLLLDMGKQVTIRQVELALGGSPGFWGANLEIRIGDTPDLADTAPATMATDVGGWVSQDLGHAVTGRYVEIWFTKLPLDSWGTYQEHVYGIAVRGYVPAAHRPVGSSSAVPTHTTSHVVHLGRGSNDPDSRDHRADPRPRGGGHDGAGRYRDADHGPGAGHRGHDHGGRGGGGFAGGPGSGHGGGPGGPGGGHGGG
jgi:hypothetical protein